MRKFNEKYKFIGSKIKQFREMAGISQKELADNIGFESATAISLIESGERKVSIKDLEKISDFLKKDIKFFLGEELTPEEKVDIRFALRADKDLSKKEQEKILDFIDFIKKRRDDR
jgi:transcriptional regulator with XRE-family HTH domain